MALVGKPRLVVDAVAAVREREHVEVPNVRDRVVSDRLELAALADDAREARPLEPVLLLRRSPVVGRASVGQNGGDAGAAGVPHVRPPRQRRPVPRPLEAVLARRVRRRHPVLLVRYVEGVTANPCAPAAVDALDERVLDAHALVAREHRPRVRVRESLRIVRLEDVDPPVLASGSRRADVEPPPTVVRPDERGALHRLRTEAVLVERDDRREALAVLRARDDGRAATRRARSYAVRDDDRPVRRDRRARRPGPPSDPAPGRLGGDHRSRRARERKGSHADFYTSASSSRSRSLRRSNRTSTP